MSHEIPSAERRQEYEHRLDLSTDEWTMKLAVAPIYAKTGVMRIRPAVPGERIVTTLADNTEGTANVAGENQVVVTNPGGEEQIVDFEKAIARYDPTDTPGLFQAKGMVRMIDNPFGHPITITAPWGEPQYGDAGCKIVALYDPSNPDVVDNDRYIIAEAEFATTYRPESKELSTSERLSSAELDRIARVIEERGSFEGYPTSQNRLRLGAAGLYLTNTMLIVPDGLWDVTNHPNRQDVNVTRLDPEVPSEEHPKVSPELSARWHKAGLLLDQYGRPVHPNWRELMSDERIGLPTGVGYFYRLGPNATVDPVVYRGREFLLIKRARGGQWAFAGGFEDRTDTSKAGAARRELGEETNLWDIGGTDEEIFFKRSTGPIATLNAWTENTVILIHGDQEYLFDIEPTPGDDAIDVGWFTLEQIAELDMFDSHRQYLDVALDRLNG